MEISDKIWIVVRDDWDNNPALRDTLHRLNRRIEGAYLDFHEADLARRELVAPDGKPRLDSYRRSWDHTVFPQFKTMRLKEFARSMGCP